MSASRTAPRNHLLASLPMASLSRLRLEEVELPYRGVVQAAGEPARTVLFPESGWCSMLAVLQEGDHAEVGLVGREGMVGLSVPLGGDAEEFEAVVQCPGRALAVEAKAFRAALEVDPALRTILLRYVLAYLGQVARTAACNCRHSLQQRMSRWLLMGHDRAEADSYPMTHEFLAMMMGVRRAGVTVAAGGLQRAGLIWYERGRVEVIDRPGLEAVACECYGAARRGADRPLGADHRLSGLSRP